MEKEKKSPYILFGALFAGQAATDDGRESYKQDNQNQYIVGSAEGRKWGGGGGGVPLKFLSSVSLSLRRLPLPRRHKC